jgi:predicted lipase
MVMTIIKIFDYIIIINWLLSNTSNNNYKHHNNHNVVDDNHNQCYKIWFYATHMWPHVCG